MSSLSTTDPINDKLRELCATIVAQPEFEAIRVRLDQFMINDPAKLQYQQLSERADYLRHKQSQGVALSDEEVSRFEQDREALLNNAVARGFLDAQEDMERIQKSVSTFLQKTFELGRVPTAAELEDQRSCGHGCGCHH